MVEVILTILIVLILLGSVIALVAKNLLSAVVSISAVGMLLSIAYLFLKAPDIALLPVVVEVISMIILIRATISVDNIPKVHETGLYPFWFNSIFIGIFALVGVKVFQMLPVFGTNFSHVAKFYLNNGLFQTGAANIVTSVILDYRAYDTLGEATILFTAILGAVAILRKKV